MIMSSHMNKSSLYKPGPYPIISSMNDFHNADGAINLDSVHSVMGLI
jgi:hypothetical protein